MNTNSTPDQIRQLLSDIAGHLLSLDADTRELCEHTTHRDPLKSRYLDILRNVDASVDSFNDAMACYFHQAEPLPQTTFTLPGTDLPQSRRTVNPDTGLTDFDAVLIDKCRHLSVFDHRRVYDMRSLADTDTARAILDDIALTKRDHAYASL